MQERAFTLVELLIVIFVIGILAALVIGFIPSYRERAYYSRTTTEFTTFANGLKLYAAKYNAFPDDVSSGLPASLNEFIAKNAQNADWPNAPWPNSVYDYDRWDISGTDTIQISVRFCPAGGPLSACTFPNEPWAAGFGVNSALYYCVQGSCRSHQNEAANYPGYCVNCPGNKAIGT